MNAYEAKLLLLVSNAAYDARYPDPHVRIFYANDEFCISHEFLWWTFTYVPLKNRWRTAKWKAMSSIYGIRKGMDIHRFTPIRTGHLKVGDCSLIQRAAQFTSPIMISKGYWVPILTWIPTGNIGLMSLYFIMYVCFYVSKEHF